MNLAKWVRFTLCLFFAITIPGLSFFLYLQGSISEGIALIRGEQIIIDKSRIALGSMSKGQKREVAFQIKNISQRELKLMGVQKSCYCIVPLNLFPITLKNGMSQSITATITAKGKPQELKEYLQIYTNNPSIGVVTVEITVHVVE